MNYIIVGIGQSNCVGQGASPYTVVNTSAYAKLFKNNGTLSGLSDPWDTEAVTSSGDIDYDSSVGASWTPSCANILTSAIPLTRFVFVPTCVTSTGYSNIGNNGTDWGYRNPSNHADVTTLYGNFVDRVNAAKNKLGDATNDQIFVVAIGGETDGVQSRTYYATYKALINLSTWIKEDVQI
jgi:gentisate 1,2-dioxygenase